MSKEKVDPLAAFIPKPVKVKRDRNMISLSPADHARITGMAEVFGCTKGKVITGLIALYDSIDNPMGH